MATWTDDRVATLTKLWADGLSASQIAGELGEVTRNAVIGKVHRLGLSGRVKSGNSTPRAKRNTTRSSTYTKNNKANSRASGGSRTNIVSIARPQSVPDVVAPEPLKISLLELTDSTCKWPIGDPATKDFYFCGHKGKDDCPYCEYHALLAYQPQAERRARRSNASR
ncbi:MAG: GcrA cell cycle regulator [Hyphomicrobiales bacterium]|nr:MAG: GcrA cell cycle regulator [Hyphomicrobiales bacterium]